MGETIPTCEDYEASIAIRQEIINLIVLTGLPPPKETVIELLAKFRATGQAAMRYLRPEVQAFARLMEDQLRANDDKKSGWKNTERRWLFQRLLEEVEELRTASRGEQTKQEAADVANFAMMIADNSAVFAGGPR